MGSPRLDHLLAYLRFDPANHTLRKDAIGEALNSGRWQLARQLIDEGLQAQPEQADLLALSGFELLHAERYVDAAAVLSKAIALGVHTADVQYNFALALFMQQRFSDALEAIAAPALSETLPATLLLRTRCLHHLGRQSEAIVDCNHYLQLQPHDPAGHGVLALLMYEQGRNDLSREHASAALNNDPAQLEALLALASVHAADGEHEAAQALFDRLTSVYPKCGRGWLGRALLALARIELESARHDIELAAKHMPDHIGTWHVFGWIHILLGDIDTAGKAFETALVLDRNFAETHGGLAVIAASRGQDEQARRWIERALRLDRQAMSPHYATLLLLQKQGQREQMQALLDELGARPVGGGAALYRDLVAARMQQLRTSLDPEPAKFLH